MGWGACGTLVRIQGVSADMRCLRVAGAGAVRGVGPKGGGEAEQPADQLSVAAARVSRSGPRGVLRAVARRAESMLPLEPWLSADQGADIGWSVCLQ